MKLQLGPQIISSYHRLSYKVWYALAEFIDNSTQAYFNNQEALDAAYKREKTQLTVSITYGHDEMGEFIRITDNSIGMSKSDLERAVIVGKPPANPTGRSKYGLGLKTGACWFGDHWTVTTKKLGSPTKHKITVDVRKVARNILTLPYKHWDAELQDHYTIIKIRELHRRITGRTVKMVKDYLRSLYRVDIGNGTLVLKWNGEALSWDTDIDSKLVTGRNKRKWKRTFNFEVNGKRVHGWAGVLEKGTRRNAGFSIIQSGRVVVGWPKSYRPFTLFGSQEGGSNDLVNQRLVGELFFEGFEVSHTKDDIQYKEGEQDKLEVLLLKKLGDLRKMALITHRAGVNKSAKVLRPAQRARVLNTIEREIRSDALKDFLKTFEIPEPGLLKRSNDLLKSAITNSHEPDLKAKINSLVVSLYLVDDMSPNDPYVIIEATESETSVIVIINLVHPHWAQLTNKQSIENFVRHCTYDGVSEWKAYFKTGKINPDTVKLIKDNLLRIPFNLANASS